MAAKKKQEKEAKYVVVKKGLHTGTGKTRREHEVGSEISLTETQAQARVGKVVLKSEYGKVAKSDSVELNDARRKIASLSDQVETLTAQVDSLNAEIAAGSGDGGA